MSYTIEIKAKHNTDQYQTFSTKKICNTPVNLIDTFSEFLASAGWIQEGIIKNGTETITKVKPVNFQSPELLEWTITINMS